MPNIAQVRPLKGVVPRIVAHSLPGDVAPASLFHLIACTEGLLHYIKSGGITLTERN